MKASRLVLVGIPAAFLGYFFVYPVGRILWTGLAPDGTPDLSSFTEAFGSQGLWGVAWFTVWQAAVSTLLTLVVALPGAYVLAKFQFPGRKLVRAAVTVPFMMPTLVVGMAFLALFGPSGLTGLRGDRTVWIILAAHVFFNYAVVVRTVGALWQHLDPSLEEAARMLGASPLQVFRRITLPLLRPALAAAAGIVFLFSFTSFGIILVLGGPGLATLEVEIFRQARAFPGHLGTAAALAILQLVGVTAILAVYSRYQRRSAIEQRLRPSVIVSRRPRTRGERLLLAGALTSMALLLGAPLAMLVERSLRTGGGYGFDAYRGLTESGRALLVPPLEAVANSLGFALATVALALLIGLLASAVVAYRTTKASAYFDVLLMLPLGTSAVTVGFGLLAAMDWPVDLRASPALVVVAHSLVAIPFVVRTTVPVMRSVQQRLREAAAVLGAGPATVWRRIDLPIIGKAALVGAGFAAAISLGEFGATSFIVRPDVPSVPVAIFRLLSQPGAANFAQAMALSTVLMLLTAAIVLAIERWRPGAIGAF